MAETTMRVVAHLDPWKLESHLLDRVAEAKRGDPLAPVLVVVPTRRLADHVARRLAERLGAAIDVEILFHRALAKAILADAGIRAPATAGSAILESILRLRLERLPDGALRRLARRAPGSTRALLRTLRDLRDAGIPPDALASEGAAELAEVYGSWSREVDRLADEGIADDAALVARALPHAPAWVSRFRAVLHHGAYELVGTTLDLVRSLDREGTPVEFLTPATEAPAARFARRFATRWLLEPDARLSAPAASGGSALGPRLSGLYDEARRFSPLDDALSCTSAQGPLAEAESAARRSLAACAAGRAPEEVAILARSLEPYAVAVESILERGEGAWDASLPASPRSDAGVRDFLAVLRAAARDFPRAATVEFLRTPRLDWGRLTPSGRPDAGAAEVESRRAGIVGGRESWTEELPAWAGAPRPWADATAEEIEEEVRRAAARAERARGVAAVVAAIATRLRPETPRSHAEHARIFRALAIELLGEGTPPVLLDAIGTLEAIERLAGDRRRVSLADAASVLDDALDDLAEGSPSAVPGGIAWLDAKQARGITFERVAIVGMNAGVVPSVPREDPFLSDDARERLREATGRPLSVKREAGEEERLLLALMLGAARDEVEISWQHADENGRARTASIALREIARIVVGSPDARALRARASALSAHPERRIRATAEASGLLRPVEREALVALGEGPLEERARTLAALRPDLSARLALVAATESFAPGDPRFDGATGREGAVDRELAATAVERLGRCPLQFFFRHVLHVRELDADPDPFAARPEDVGVDVHAWLRDVYAALFAEGLLPGPSGPALERGRALVDEKLAAAIPGERARRLPVLARHERDRWRTALRAFLERDLAGPALRDALSAELEVSRSGRISLGDGRLLRVRARFDRVLSGPGGVVVGDYKTGGSVAKRTSVAAILRAETMQAPLYREIQGGNAAVEILGVGPEHAEGAPKEARATLERFVDGGHRDDWIASVAAVVALAAKGRFPLSPGDPCSYCGYRRACRHSHPPTAKRRENDPRLAAFRAVKEKSSKRGGAP